MASIFVHNSAIHGCSELVDLFRKYAPAGLVLRSDIHNFTVYYDTTTKRYIYNPDRGRISEMRGVWIAMTEPYNSFIVRHPPRVNLCKLH